MIVEALAWVTDGEIHDLSIYDMFRLSVFDLASGDKVVVLVGGFADSELEVPIAFAKSWADGVACIGVMTRAVLEGHRLVDMRNCAFTPPAELVAQLAAMMPECTGGIDRGKRRPAVIIKGRQASYAEPLRAEESPKMPGGR